jgi:HSP20 family protein
MRRFPLSPSDPEGWVPNSDIYVSEDGGLVILVELAGMKKEDLELTVEASRLLIRGERPDGGRRIKYEHLAQGLDYGHFESVAEVPSRFDLSRAKASYQNGILRIDVPRKPEQRDKGL